MLEQTQVRPHFFICWITLHLRKSQSAAIRKKIKIKIDPDPKL